MYVYNLYNLYLVLLLFLLPGFYLYFKITKSLTQSFFYRTPEYFLLSLSTLTISGFICSWLNIATDIFLIIFGLIYIIFLFLIITDKKIINMLKTNLFNNNSSNYLLLLFISALISYFLVCHSTDTVDHIGKMVYLSSKLDITIGKGIYITEGLRFEIYPLFLAFLSKLVNLSIPELYFYICGWLLWITIIGIYRLTDLFLKKTSHCIIATTLILTYIILFLYIGNFMLLNHDNISVVYVILPIFTIYLFKIYQDDSKKSDHIIYFLMVIVLSTYHKANYLHILLINSLLPLFLFIIERKYRIIFNEKQLLLTIPLCFTVLLFLNYTFSKILGRYWFDILIKKIGILVFIIGLIAILSYLFFLKIKYMLKKMNKIRLLPLFLTIIPLFILFLSNYQSKAYKAENYNITAHTLPVQVTSKFICLSTSMISYDFWILMAASIILLYFNRKAKYFKFFLHLFISILSIIFFPPLTTLLIMKIPLWILGRIRVYFYLLSIILFFTGVLNLSSILPKKSKSIMILIILMLIVGPFILFRKNMVIPSIIQRVQNIEYGKKFIDSYEGLLRQRSIITNILSLSKSRPIKIRANTPRFFSYYSTILPLPIDVERNNWEINCVFIKGWHPPRKDFIWIDVLKTNPKIIDNLADVFAHMKKYKYNIFYHHRNKVLIGNSNLIKGVKKNFLLNYVLKTKQISKTPVICGNGKVTQELEQILNNKFSYKRDNGYIKKIFFKDTIPDLYTFYWLNLFEDNKILYNNLEKVFKKLIEHDLSIIYHSGYNLLLINNKYLQNT